MVYGKEYHTEMANLLFTRELQRRLAAAGSSTISVAAHPGASSTNLGHETPGGVLGWLMQVSRPTLDRYLSQSSAMGALPTERAAVDPDVAGGDYFGPDGRGEQKGHPVKVSMSKRALDGPDARRLWEISEELTGVEFGLQ